MNICAGITALLLVAAFVPPVMAGSLTGTAVFKGSPPKPKQLKVNSDAICMAVRGGPLYTEHIVLGEGNTLANVFIQVKNPPEGKYPAPTEAAVLDQKGCNYQPHVQVVRVGQPLKILNPDGTMHNVHAMAKSNPAFNLSMPKFRTETVVTFKKPEGMFAVKCDVHPWMGAWIAVMDHPFFTVTKTDGAFTIDNLPDGTYTIEAWHERLGTQTAQITVAGGRAEPTEFVFVAPGQQKAANP